MLSTYAASIKSIDLFDGEEVPVSEGNDVSDWIEGHRREGVAPDSIAERLCTVVENADYWGQHEPSMGVEPDTPSVFSVKTVNEWIDAAKSTPIPKMLFDTCWYEGELCILFADTGKGKTILAVQIADAISRGVGIAGFALEAPKQMVLYLDFELTQKQFETRYAEQDGEEYINHFVFGEKFVRAEIDQERFVPSGFRDFQEYLGYSLEYELEKSGVKVLIVDNITYLRNATETAKDALPLMKELIRLKKKYGLSILALAHTPKRDLSRALNVNDLQGSKMLSNFADSIFAIGESSKDKDLRYLKQIKTRSAELIYDAQNVATCQVTKHNNFLQFEFVGFESEREHLRSFTDDDRTALIQNAKALAASGKTQREISRELGIAVGTVNKYLKMD